MINFKKSSLSFLTENLATFKNLKILVIGDVMIDHYIIGNATRISPEAPVPIINVVEEKYYLGGAANVALNIKKLSCDVTILGVIGRDTNGTLFKKLLKKNKINSDILEKNNVKTITKTRIINNNYQITRLDKENHKDDYCPKDISESLKNIAKHDIIIISDYDKGFLNHKICKKIISISKTFNKKVIVDPKGNDFSKYQNAYLLTPNLKEFNIVINAFNNRKDANSNAIKLKNQINIDNLIVTKGEKGANLYFGKDNFFEFEGIKTTFSDVVGAGDTFVASMSVFLALNCDIKLSTYLANICAGLVVQKKGTNFINIKEILSYLTKNTTIVNEGLLDILIKNKFFSKEIVFTNGCFDILHPGHVNLFKSAKSKGDVLIVAINSDSSIEKIKGKGRPINNINFRLKMLRSIKYIDYIIEFDELTPINLIKKIKPNILFKGGDYKKSEIVGYKEVLSYGGKVLTNEYDQNFSSSKIIKTIKDLR